MSVTREFIGSNEYLRIEGFLSLRGSLHEADRRILARVARHLYVGISSMYVSCSAWGSGATAVYSLTVPSVTVYQLLLRKASFSRGCVTAVDVRLGVVQLRFTEKSVRVTLNERIMRLTEDFEQYLHKDR